MPEIKLVAEPRTHFGKGAARKIRRDHKIPAVLYGHGTAPVHISLPGHDTMMALKNANALLSIEIGGDSRLALAKDVQRDPIKPLIEHVDLVVVRRDEKVVVDVPVTTVGEATPETVVTVESQTVQLQVLATNIPEHIVVSVKGLEAGTQVLTSQLELPPGAELITDPDVLVVNVSQQISAEELEAELAEAEAEAGIEHEAPEAEVREVVEGQVSGGAAGESAAQVGDQPAAGEPQQT
jgi:large subunit ribosomal protein L25